MAKPSMKCVSCDKVITHKDPKQRKGLCYDCWFLEAEKSPGVVVNEVHLSIKARQ